MIYAPLNKQKPSAFQGKQTVKSLMEIGSATGKGGLSASAQKLLAQGGYTDGAAMAMAQSKTMGASSGQGGLFKPSYPGTSVNESPTRRFKKPQGEAKISSDLLGAGDDPMAKN